MIFCSTFLIFTHLFIFLVFSEQKCMLCFGFRYIRWVSLFWLQQILRVPQQCIARSYFCFLCHCIHFHFIACQTIFAVAQTFTVWDSKPNTSFLKRNLYDISVNKFFNYVLNLYSKEKERAVGRVGEVSKKARNLVSTGPKVMKFMQNK